MTLKTIGAAALKKHQGNVEKALPEFIRAVKAQSMIPDLARSYLSHIAASGPDPVARETPTGRVGPAPSPKPAVKETPANGSITVTKHPVREHKRRTHEEKQAALAAAAASVEAVFDLPINGRAIGKYAVGELAALKRDLVDDAAHKLMLGTDAARNAVLAELIEQHCTVQDQLTPVRDVIDAATLKQFVMIAEQEAPRRIALGMQRAADAIAQRKEVAA